ncbi:MAG: enoyl-CoA hydratase-related protein [Alphaproteobacteria bacterium]|nr:enoyl-CoA hydratase-related protein [Alphaproteobacteria bacterium]MCD8519749.1 enoyl-CoA hydratase-related protein [Alphaproteobacteria bacterium]MCD8525779.1 enoyl-CoA hydratase-related protein [Alphaproteobacteria bacterium]
MTDSVLLTIENNAATVTMNRPDVHNAFDEGMIERLAAVFGSLEGRNDIHAVVLRGEGKSFSAGADLNWMKRAAAYSEAENKRDALALAWMLNTLNSLPQVTIARVHGAALGGGLGLVSCCDIVIAAPEAVFALSEVKLGLIPATIGPYVIRAIGERQARRFFQTGERFSAQKAYEIGFVHELSGNENIDDILLRILTEIGKNGAHAMQEAKRLCFDLAGKEISETLINETAKRIAEIRTGDEAQGRLKAFLEKR